MTTVESPTAVASGNAALDDAGRKVVTYNFALDPVAD
jgi:hypothetical protein